jgi:hypothetical protein
MAANAPAALVDQYIGNLKMYHAIAIDVGDQDGFRFDAAKLHDIPDSYGVDNSFEVYQETHTSEVADRFHNNVMLFFSKNLCFPHDCRQAKNNQDALCLVESQTCNCIS